MRVRYSTLKRQKSISSHAASISAWCAVFDWLSIVAAFRVERHGPDRSSAARRKTAARSCQGVRDQSACAARAASIACWTCSGPPLLTSARTWLLRCGMTASKDSSVETSLPPMTSGIETRSLSISRRRFFSSSRSGEPGAYDLMGSLTGGGGVKMPGALMPGFYERWDREPNGPQYAVPGWGVGELWTATASCSPTSSGSAPTRMMIRARRSGPSSSDA